LENKIRRDGAGAAGAGAEGRNKNRREERPAKKREGVEEMWALLLPLRAFGTSAATFGVEAETRRSFWPVL